MFLFVSVYAWGYVSLHAWLCVSTSLSCVSVCVGGLASKVKRKDTLALRLGARTSAPEEGNETGEEQEEEDPSSWQSRDQWEAVRTKISTSLTRCDKQSKDRYMHRFPDQ